MAAPRYMAVRPLASGLARPVAKHRSQLLGAVSQSFVRRKSGPYGYTQAKALVFMKNGEPSDVLKYAS
jgi:trans-2-enoyl-CoA reductase